MIVILPWKVFLLICSGIFGLTATIFSHICTFCKKELQNINLCLFFLFVQVLGVSSQTDRAMIKKKLKEMKKAQEKLEKQREKRDKEARRSGKVPGNADTVC